MTDYNEILDTQIDQDSALTEDLMTQMRDNPIAIAEGATGAPRITQSAIAAPEAGDDYTIRSGSVSLTGTSSGNDGESVYCEAPLRSGTIRVNLNITKCEVSSRAQIYRSTTDLVQTITSTGAYSYDVNISNGSVVRIVFTADSGGGSSADLDATYSYTSATDFVRFD